MAGIGRTTRPAPQPDATSRLTNYWPSSASSDPRNPTRYAAPRPAFRPATTMPPGQVRHNRGLGVRPGHGRGETAYMGRAGRVANGINTVHLSYVREKTCAEAARPAAEGPAPLGGSLRREGFQGRPLVRLGLDRHRQPAAPVAGPPPPEDRRAGLPLLLRARRPAADQDPADLRRRAALAGGEDFELSTGCFGLDQCQVRLYTAIARHVVMAALAICAVTALLKDRTGPQAPPPVRPDQPPPAEPGMIPLTVPEIRLRYFQLGRIFALSVRVRCRPSQTAPSGTQRARWRRPLRPELSPRPCLESRGAV